MGALTDVGIIELELGQRADRFALELLNADRTPLGVTLDAHEDATPTVQADTSRTSFRTVSGLTISNPPDVELGPLRARPVITLQNGSSYDLGVLMFGTDTRRIYTAGNLWNPELFDENFLLDQDLDRTWSLPAGGDVLAFFVAMAGEVLGPLGIPTDYQVATVANATPLNYAVGSSRLKALNAMAALLAAFPPFFANSGAHTMKSAPTLAGAADHTYSTGTRIFDGTTALKSSRYKAPNRYIVVGDDVGGFPVRGVYDLPPAAPNSQFQTGRIVTAPPHRVSGVTDQDLANQIAYVDALTDSKTTYATASFDAAADPRHDLFDTVDLFGVRYLESGWSMQFGGDHSHSLTRMWS